MIASVLFSFSSLMAPGDSTLEPEVFARQVVTHHPRASRAGLYLAYADMEMLRARALTQPGVDITYDRKQFDGKNYWNLFSGEVNMPTRLGLEFYGNYDLNSGQNLNPEQSLPSGGLYAAGVKIPLGYGLWQNPMRYQFRRAGIMQQNAKWQQSAALNDLLREAMLEYWNWVESYHLWKINELAQNISYKQLSVVRTSALIGERPIIDTLESYIQWQTRQLASQEAEMNYRRNQQSLVKYVWMDEMRVRLENGVLNPPGMEYIEAAESVPDSVLAVGRLSVQNPELLQLEKQQEILDAELRFRRNRLIPKAEFKYNMLYDPNQQFQALQTFGTDYYKASIGVSIPVFLRKERAEYTLTKLKMNELDWKRQDKTRELYQKMQSYYTEYRFSLQNMQVQRSIASNYLKMLQAEEIRFSNGESSVFLINQRENMYFQSQLKVISLEIRWRKALIQFYHSRGDLQVKLTE